MADKESGDEITTDDPEAPTEATDAEEVDDRPK